MDYQSVSRFGVQQKPSKRCLQPKYPFPRIYQRVPDKLQPENQAKKNQSVVPVNPEVRKDMNFNSKISNAELQHNPFIKTLSITNLIREEVQSILRELNLTNKFLCKEEVDNIIEKCVKGKLAAKQVDELSCMNTESDSDAKPDIEVTVQMLNDNDKSKLIVENFQMLEQRITKLEEKIQMAKSTTGCHEDSLNTNKTKSELHLQPENRQPSYKDVAVATEPVTDYDNKDFNKNTDFNNNTDDAKVESEINALLGTNKDNSSENVKIGSVKNDQNEIRSTQIEIETSDKCEDILELSTEFNYYDELYYMTRQRDRNQLTKSSAFHPFQISKQPQINPFAKPISMFKPHGGLIKGQKARFISD